MFVFQERIYIYSVIGCRTLALTCVIGQWLWSWFSKFTRVVKRKNVYRIKNLIELCIEIIVFFVKFVSWKAPGMVSFAITASVNKLKWGCACIWVICCKICPRIIVLWYSSVGLVSSLRAFLSTVSGWFRRKIDEHSVRTTLTVRKISILSYQR